MKAMILAAGLGTRLRPLTDSRPKALVEVGGRTLLEIALSRLRAFGICEVIINVHHFADMVVNYLKSNQFFNLRIEISREEKLLDTGGGLKKAAWFFLENPSRTEPFLLHNVDVLTTIDLGGITRFHNENQALATLAVQNRQTSRRLLFDENSELCGRQTGTQPAEFARPECARHSNGLQPLAFSGIHVISPQLLPLLSEQGAFPIIASYLRLSAMREKILGFRADEYYWRDVGKPEELTLASQELDHLV
jgi:NDP-sugar pyrophosphorylase family protein